VTAVTLYDRIGTTYAAARKTDPRIARAVDASLGDAQTVLNVGAGAGSYEPSDRDVVALELSPVMIGQRPPGAAPVIQGRAERLPFADGVFDAAMAILTVHHWADPLAGISELARVASHVSILTVDAPVSRRFWLVREYLPSIARWDLEHFPSIGLVVEALAGAAEVVDVPVPASCEDGFLAAYWRRPERYLDQEARAPISTFSLVDPVDIDQGLRRLRRDLEDGTWLDRHAGLLDVEALDCGYRLVMSTRT
jgi:SAM-dependent methyltransferase